MTTPTSPLQGMNLLSLAINIPGPVAASRLLSLGATVTKVEPAGGDPLQTYVPELYAKLTQGQRALKLDLKAAPDRAELDALLGKADLLLTSSRPAGLRRLGLDWPVLHDQFPRLCYVAIVGHPAPEQNLAGHDLTYQAASGLLAPPAMPRTLIADLGGAERAVTAATGLLLARERGFGAGYEEVALSDAAAAFAMPLAYGLTREQGMLGGGFPAYDIYETKSGYVAVAALEPHFWIRLEAELGGAPLTREVLEAAFPSKTAEEWELWGLQRDLPITRVR